MSKIVSPLPAFVTDFTPPPTACWWRLKLESNDDGNQMVIRTNGSDVTGDMSDATWVEWEFFDGHDTILDTGLDRLDCLVRIETRGHRYFLDILHDGPPTPSHKWNPLTRPGSFTHPDDRAVA